jgi:hypothetical protein
LRLVPSLWVAELHISDRTAEKLRAKHQLEPDDVRNAIVGVRGLRFTWNTHPERGTRAIIETWISGDRVLVVLYPRPSEMGDAWNLGSAYRVR